MSREEIIKRVIKKAENNGWKFDAEMFTTFVENPILFMFDQDFAKAFWGNGRSEKDLGNGLTLWESEKGALIMEGEHQGEILPYWKLQLQEMVLQENPLEYLEKFL